MIIRPIAFNPAMVRLKRIVAGMTETDRRILVTALMKGEEQMQDINQTIIELIRKHGRKRTAIAEELNDRGFKTTKGGTWTGNNLGMHIKAHGLYEKAEVITSELPSNSQEPEPFTTNKVTTAYQEETKPLYVEPEPLVNASTSDEPNRYQEEIEVSEVSSQHITSEIPIQLTTSEIAAIKELVELYQTGKLTPSGGMTMPERRPLFQGAKRNTGIMVNQELHELAEAKRKTEVEKVGSSFSLLVEYLLWAYVGQPMKLVAGAEERGE